MRDGYRNHGERKKGKNRTTIQPHSELLSGRITIVNMIEYASSECNSMSCLPNEREPVMRCDGPTFSGLSDGHASSQNVNYLHGMAVGNIINSVERKREKEIRWITTQREREKKRRLMETLRDI